MLIRIPLLLLALFATTQANAAPNAWSKVATPTKDQPDTIGGYSHGCFTGGDSMPSEGRGYQVVRLSRNRYYGHPSLIQYLKDLADKVADEELGLMLVADMGQPRGGPMPGGHVSHQNGLDADIWLPLNYKRTKGKRDNLKSIAFADRKNFTLNRDVWTKGQARLIQLAAQDPRVARILVNPVIKIELCSMQWDDRSWLRKIRPWWKHHTHFHVRLHCPKGDSDCKPQGRPPAGDGCGTELASWRPENRKKSGKSKKSSRPAQPKRCKAVLKEK